MPGIADLLPGTADVFPSHVRFVYQILTCTAKFVAEYFRGTAKSCKLEICSFMYTYKKCQIHTVATNIWGRNASKIWNSDEEHTCSLFNIWYTTCFDTKKCVSIMIKRNNTLLYSFQFYTFVHNRSKGKTLQ